MSGLLIEWKPFTRPTELVTVEEFREGCRSGRFVDGWEWAYWATASAQSDASAWSLRSKPKEATHVAIHRK